MAQAPMRHWEWVSPQGQAVGPSAPCQPPEWQEACSPLTPALPCGRCHQLKPAGVWLEGDAGGRAIHITLGQLWEVGLWVRCLHTGRDHALPGHLPPLFETCTRLKRCGRQDKGRVGRKGTGVAWGLSWR